LLAVVIGLGRLALAEELPVPAQPCSDACTSEQRCVDERCVLLFEGAFVEGRFTIAQPTELGSVASSILDTIEMLGIDLKLAAMTFGAAEKGSWDVEYGSALGDRQGNYTYQGKTRPRISLVPLGSSGLKWTSEPFVYTFAASIRFLGVHINIGPILGYETNIEVEFSEGGALVYSRGLALLPASQAQALDFMTQIVVTDVNALFVAGLGCTDVCDLAVCAQTGGYLPQNGLEVIECNPTVQPAGRRDFGQGVEAYYPMEIRFHSTPLPQGLQEP
jgi:hypothetical protein